MKAVARIGFPLVALLSPSWAQNAVHLPEMTVYSNRVANQDPAGAMAMPVSLLRFEPQVDIQSRNLAEGQADITLRGGTFENTIFQIGAVSVFDSQTGHYHAELPVAPVFLTMPQVLTGTDVALQASNATVGAVAYGWNPVRNAGFAHLSAGQFRLARGEFYQGAVRTRAGTAGRIGADVAVSHSESDGSVPWGEHAFDRLNVRLQHASRTAQTDLFAGYQAKHFGWPNLYTPFNSNETEDLQTVLLAANHRRSLPGTGYLEAGIFHRRNKDDYAFNRFAPVGPLHPFQHTTWNSGAAARGRVEAGAAHVEFRAEVMADRIESTSLVFGPYRTRTLTKFAVAPEISWPIAREDRLTLKGGASFDDSNRDGGRVSPFVLLSRESGVGAVPRIYLGYTEASQLPSYTALRSNPAAGLFRGNPNLGRERSRNLEAGAEGKVAGWALRGALFWRRDDALVDWTFRRGVTARTANAMDLDVSGVELLATRTWAKWDLVVGYAALGKHADYRGAPVDASFYALNYARHRLTAAVIGRLGKGVELRVDNVARWQADNLLRTAGGEQAVATSVGLSFRPRRLRGVELHVGADNLWDSDFQEVPGVTAARRQFSGGVRYAW